MIIIIVIIVIIINIIIIIIIVVIIIIIIIPVLCSYTIHRNQGLISSMLTSHILPLEAASGCGEGCPEEGPSGHQFQFVLRCGGEGGGRGGGEGGGGGGGVGGGEGGGRGGGGEGEGRGWEVKVTCAGKKDGQTSAAQAMLKVMQGCQKFGFCPSNQIF